MHTPELETSRLLSAYFKRLRTRYSSNDVQSARSVWWSVGSETIMSAWMNDGANGRTNERRKGRTKKKERTNGGKKDRKTKALRNEWTNERMNERTFERTNARTNERTNRRTNERTNEWISLVIASRRQAASTPTTHLFPSERQRMRSFQIHDSIKAHI